jgi:hypothetical protein
VRQLLGSFLENKEEHTGRRHDKVLPRANQSAEDQLLVLEVAIAEGLVKVLSDGAAHAVGLQAAVVLNVTRQAGAPAIAFLHVARQESVSNRTDRARIE